VPTDETSNLFALLGGDAEEGDSSDEEASEFDSHADIVLDAKAPMPSRRTALKQAILSCLADDEDED